MVALLRQTVKMRMGNIYQILITVQETSYLYKNWSLGWQKKPQKLRLKLKLSLSCTTAAPSQRDIPPSSSPGLWSSGDRHHGWPSESERPEEEEEDIIKGSIKPRQTGAESVFPPTHLLKCVQGLLNVFQVMQQLPDSHQLDSMDRMGIREILSSERRDGEQRWRLESSSDR